MNPKQFEAPVPGRSTDQNPAERPEFDPKVKGLAQEIHDGKRKWCVVTTPKLTVMQPMEIDEIEYRQEHTISGFSIQILTNEDAKAAVASQKGNADPVNREAFVYYDEIFKALDAMG